MALKISYVERLEDVLGPVREFLSRDGDLFARPRIVVPTAGAKAWLWNELAKSLGASSGAGGAGRHGGDGIVANVDISYPGTILGLLQPPRGIEPDPWSFDRLTFTVLDVITGPGAAAFGIPFDVTREPLLAARRIAGFFDEYHVRRPGMIREWERDKENPVLEPTANDEQRDGRAVPKGLREEDRWQFRLWREVSRRIGKPSPPSRASVAHDTSREPLLVAGLQSLALSQLTCLETLAETCDVAAVLVHPSSGLRSLWALNGQVPLPRPLRDLPLEKHRDPECPAGVDPLLAVWLSGARELQDLLTARGFVATETPPDNRPGGGQPPTLLGRMQETIACGRITDPEARAPVGDRSVMIHRCHSLSRQAEVLHDALLQAFAEMPDLEPHDIAIVSPCLEKAAPHLQAVFQRAVVGRHPDAQATDANDHRVTLPLVVADRGLRETSEAADLLTALLAIPGSRASVSDVLGVAGHALVRKQFRLDDDTVATWTDFIERTAVRWGLDSRHRRRAGLALAQNSEVHTWKMGLERMLLGATLPDAAPCPELGGVVPLDDLETTDLARVTKLVHILGILRDLEADATETRPAAAWCDVIERALIDLCGEECPELAEPLGHLRRLCQAAAGGAGGQVPVPFADVRGLLMTWLDERTGRQPLRTGAITATSMVPLRSVPFKVICVFGYDAGAVGASEADGDDLVGRQDLVGDVDPRVDIRRSLIDCVVAAGRRLVITCNGRNAKSNKRVPLVTPLAELVDFAVRHGVTRPALDALSGIEIDHPRHQLSRRNFEDQGVEATGLWSHDGIARDVLDTIEKTRRSENAAPQAAGGAQATSRPPAAASTGSAPDLIDIALLEQLVRDPLRLHLEHTLGIDTWRDEDEPIPATLPLVLPRRQARDLTTELLAAIFGKDDHSATVITQTWLEANRTSGILPLGPHVQRQVDEIVALAHGLATGLGKEGIDLRSLASRNLADINQSGPHRLVGLIPGLTVDERQLVVVTPHTAGKDQYDRPLHMAALHLIIARGLGLPTETVTIISRHNDWKLGKLKPVGPRNPHPRPADSWQSRVVTLAAELMPQSAAVRRLDELVALMREAIGQPRPAFGKVLTTDASDRETAFETALKDEYYWRSSECALFGVSPNFADVFTAHPERIRFVDDFQRLLTPVYDNKAGDYKIA